MGSILHKTARLVHRSVGLVYTLGGMSVRVGDIAVLWIILSAIVEWVLSDSRMLSTSLQFTIIHAKYANFFSVFAQYSYLRFRDSVSCQFHYGEVSSPDGPFDLVKAHPYGWLGPFGHFQALPPILTPYRKRPKRRSFHPTKSVPMPTCHHV